VGRRDYLTKSDTLVWGDIYDPDHAVLTDLAKEFGLNMSSAITRGFLTCSALMLRGMASARAGSKRCRIHSQSWQSRKKVTTGLPL
jgi:hypothetical protein